jgi:bifunctional non-homologous end joining protein LigD
VAQQNGLEGIIAKQKNATYSPGYRTKSWLKIKAETRHEAVICGYTKNKDTDRLFSSLVLGITEGEKVKFIGQVGTGFTGASQQNIFEKLKPLFTDDCPFEKIPKTGVPTFWVKPHLVCEVKYTELTSEGLMRHPSFQGLRKDKTIADLNLEEKKAVATKQIDEPVSSSKKKLLQKPTRRKLRQKQL